MKNEIFKNYLLKNDVTVGEFELIKKVFSIEKPSNIDEAMDIVYTILLTR